MITISSSFFLWRVLLCSVLLPGSSHMLLVQGYPSSANGKIVKGNRDFFLRKLTEPVSKTGDAPACTLNDADGLFDESFRVKLKASEESGVRDNFILHDLLQQNFDEDVFRQSIEKEYQDDNSSCRVVVHQAAASLVVLRNEILARVEGYFCGDCQGKARLLLDAIQSELQASLLGVDEKIEVLDVLTHSEEGSSSVFLSDKVGDENQSLGEKRSLQDSLLLCSERLPETEFESVVFAIVDTGSMVALTQEQADAIGGVFLSSHQEALEQGAPTFCDPYFRKVQNVTIVKDEEYVALDPNYHRVNIRAQGICQNCKSRDVLYQAEPDSLMQVPTFNTTSGGCSCPGGNITRRMITEEELFNAFSSRLLTTASLNLVSIQQAVPVTCGVNQVPFTFRSIVEFNRSCASGLSINDKRAIGKAYVTSYNQLVSQNYCDPYFRVLENATIVLENATIVQEKVATADGKFRVEVEVTGALRCADPTAPDCSVDEIGLFDLPSKTVLVNRRNLQQRRDLQQGECSCPADAIADRGILESEFLDEFEEQVEAIAPTLECPDVQIAGDCAFGSLFDSVLQVNFADPIAAQEASEQIGAAALESLKAVFSPANTSVCNLDFRAFESAQVIFTNSARRQLDEDISNTRHLQADSTLSTSEPPSLSPTTLFGSMPTNSTTNNVSSTVGLLVVSGACAGCSNDLFPANQVSDSSRSWEHLRGLVEQRSSSRYLQENSKVATSNCFCGLNATIFERVPSISEFQALLQERLPQLEITGITQVKNDALVFNYPCTKNVTSFDKNVTLEIQYNCAGTSDAPQIADEVKASIAESFKQTYNSLKANLCDPFNIRVDSARVVEVGKFRNGTSSLPFQLSLTVLCNGCDVSSTNLYGFPSDDGSPYAPTRRSRRDLSFLEEKLKYAPPGTRRAQEGTCTCSALLPRRAPLEAEVTAAMSPALQGLGLACIGNTTECQFGSGFGANILFEIQLGATLDEEASGAILLEAFTTVLTGAINCENPYQCNQVAGYLTDADFSLDFVYNSMGQGSSDTTAGSTTRRDLQFFDGIVDANSTLNVSDAPSASPTIDSSLILLSSSGVCNGCPNDLLNGNQASARRALETLGDLKDVQMTDANDYRFLQDGDSTTAAEDSSTCTNNTSGESRPESDCYCPVSSVVIASSSFVFDRAAFIQDIIDTARQLGGDFTVIGSQIISRVECSAETTFTTLISFEFSAFQWIIYNMNDVQVLGNQVANAYNNLVAQHCDHYFRNSVTLTFVPGTLELKSSDGSARHGRDLQTGCYNYIATFRVDGLCRGCQDLGSPIPLFGASSLRKLGARVVDWEMKPSKERGWGFNEDRMTTISPKDRNSRQLQKSASCICDEIASQNPDAPSRADIQNEISSVNWPALGQGTICGLPVDPVVDCPRTAAEMTGIAATVPISFWVSRKDGECLTLADVSLLADTFMQEFNAIKGDGRYFPCQPEYVQISSVTFDPNIIGNCRRRLVDGRWLRDGISVEIGVTFQSNTGTDVARAAIADNVVEVAQTNVNVKTSLTALSSGTTSPSSVPSSYPSSFPSVFPSSFPSSLPSSFPSSSPLSSQSSFPPTSFPSSSPLFPPSNMPSGKCPTSADSCTGGLFEVLTWCNSFAGTDYACCSTGDISCQWDGLATISKGSCKGTRACFLAAGSESIATTTVGANSCNGDNACDQIGFWDTISQFATSVSIDGNSCNGNAACYEIAQAKGETVSIGSGSCNADFACMGVGRSKTTSAKIGTNSCIEGEYACYCVACNLATSVEILSSTCTATACLPTYPNICGGSFPGRFGDYENKVTCDVCDCTSSP